MLACETVMVLGSFGTGLRSLFAHVLGCRLFRFGLVELVCGVETWTGLSLFRFLL